MKKIPTLFERVFENHKKVGIKPNVTEGMEWVLNGEGVATVKVDGSCCAIIDGIFYKRYDAKKGKKAPADAIPCCEPDPVTGHHPHWVKVDGKNSTDKWFCEAFNNAFDYALVEKRLPLKDGTYEAIGIHFQGNPYGLDCDILVKHGQGIVEVERSFEGIKEWLRTHNEEGLVFWKDGEPKCKIKRSDFGFEWNT